MRAIDHDDLEILLLQSYYWLPQQTIGQIDVHIRSDTCIIRAHCGYKLQERGKRVCPNFCLHCNIPLLIIISAWEQSTKNSINFTTIKEVILLLFYQYYQNTISLLLTITFFVSIIFLEFYAFFFKYSLDTARSILLQ